MWKKLFYALAFVAFSALATASVTTPAHAAVNCTLPFNLSNGTRADAGQVQGNFSALVACLGSAAKSGANNDITSLTAVAHAITNFNLAPMPVNTVKCNSYGGPGGPQDCPLGATFSFAGTAGTMLQTSAFTGDVTTPVNSFATTVSPNVVTNAKLAQMPGSTVKCNSTVSLANAQDCTLGAAFSYSGTLLQTNAFTGDVTTPANSFATTVSANAITNAKLAQMPTVTVKCNSTGSLANAQDCTLGAAFSFSGTTLRTNAFTGDVTTPVNSVATTISANAVTNAKLAQMPAVTAKCNPTGSLANAQDCTLGATLSFSGTALQTNALTGDVTTPANSFATTIAANAVTNAKLAQMTANTVKCNPTGSLANAQDCTTLPSGTTLATLTTSTIRTVTAATDTATATDVSLIFNGTATQTETLPAASSNSGRIIMVKNIAAFAVNSASANVVPLAGGAAGTAILAATAGKYATLQSDGTNWQIMAGN